MSEKSLILQGWGVLATLAGLKTQTRRVIKPQPPADTVRVGIGATGFARAFALDDADTAPVWEKSCPYGKAGDTLWVREKWSVGTGDGVRTGLNIQYASGPPWLKEVPEGHRDDALLVAGKHGYGTWRSSIHMPRWASRLFLRLKSVRVERVQDIGADDYVREGVEATPEGTIKVSFIALWNLLNAKRGYGWTVNPWVWVVEFERIEEPKT